MFAEKVYYRIDWDRIPVENILDKMVPMSDNLKRSSYRKYVLDYKEFPLTKDDTKIAT